MADDLTISFDDLRDPRFLQPSYQPIVDLSSQRTVAVEALARWPQLNVNPDAAFQLAKRLGRVAELDMACRNAAIDHAINTGLPENFALFVNLEPSTITAESARQLVERTQGKLNLVTEITERELMSRPAELIKTVNQLCAANCVVALDDVGAEPDSLAMLPLVAPAVVKLDISLVRRWPNARQAAILTAVAAYAERTGAVVLAEGVENEFDLDQAMALGASLAQGWLFGRPGPLQKYSSPEKLVVSQHFPIPIPNSPFEAVDRSKLRFAKKGLLLGISHHLESQGLHLQNPPVILSTFQSAERFTPDTSRRYSLLAERCPLVAALGENMSAEPLPGVRGIDLAINDPLVDEWVVVVVGTHYHGALIAKDLGDTGSIEDRDRRFSYVVTHNSDTVLAAARSLLQKVAPTDS